MAPTHHLRTVSSLAELADVRGWVVAVVDGSGVHRGDAELVATELLSNAIRHAHSTADLAVTVGRDTVRFAVTDRSVEPPAVASHPDAAGGFGLRLVASVSTRWGWDPETDGKTVWCELPRDPAARPEPR
jgi:hypothetical protein